ncbi:MAG TPA: glycosyltransferase [Nitrospirae bacterium]|nr:glycosyltransferase [Nitrospirota bacterium]
MSVYNGREHLAESIESILAQTLKDFEFIIVDDCSTDNTLKILSTYQQKDKRIKVVENDKNIGLTRSLNKAIKMAEGDFIARHDADDTSFADRLEKQYSIIRQAGADVVGSQAHSNIKNTLKVVPRTDFLENLTLSKLKFGNIFIHGTLFFKTTVLKQYLYDQDMKYAQDYELMIRLLKNGKSVYMINEVLYFLRVQDSSLSKAHRNEQLKYAKLACKKHFGSTLFFMDGRNIVSRIILRSLRKIIGN